MGTRRVRAPMTSPPISSSPPSPEEDSFVGKSIIVMMPADVGLYAEVERGLRRLGLRVRMISPRAEDFRYRGLTERLRNLWHKALGDRDFKHRLMLSRMPAQVDRALAAAEPADFALVIRADCFTHEQLAAVRRKSGRCYGFHWDGLGRFPGIEERIAYFRRFYVFDPSDARPADGIIQADNFWFERIADSPPAPATADVYHVCTYDRRAPFVLATCERLRRLGQTLRVLMVGAQPGPRPGIPGVAYPLAGPTYSENLDQLPSARVILDVPHLDLHRGLSFRVFEALGAGKKLITTNPLVLERDFYHPDNIHLLTEDDGALARFLATPYRPLDPAVTHRYAFSSWLRRVLEVG